MTQIQLHNGDVLFNDGKVAIDPACCCGCPQCTRLPTSATVEFLANVNATGSGAGCGGGCADFVAAWELHKLTQAEVDSLSANWPMTWPQTTPVPREAGCYFGLFEGLPCEATSMVVQILNGGAGGLAVATVTIGWADGVFAQITCTHAVDPPSSDCVANLTRENEGAPGVTLGVNDSPGVPCDFAMLAVGMADELVLTMNP